MWPKCHLIWSQFQRTTPFWWVWTELKSPKQNWCHFENSFHWIAKPHAKETEGTNFWKARQIYLLNPRNTSQQSRLSGKLLKASFVDLDASLGLIQPSVHFSQIQESVDDFLVFQSRFELAFRISVQSQSVRMITIWQVTISCPFAESPMQGLERIANFNLSSESRDNKLISHEFGLQRFCAVSPVITLPKLHFPPPVLVLTSFCSMRCQF